MNRIREKKHFLLGVTGGIASGKTTVSRILSEMGWPAIDFDRLAREVVRPGTEGLEKIAEAFGPAIIASDKTLDRKALSGIVFQDEAKRKKLEAITHPLIHQAYERQLAEILKETPDTVVQAVVPLLYEVGMETLFDRVLVVYVPQKVQIERLCERDGIHEDKALSIIRSQMPIDEKKDRAHYVIDNTGSLSETRKQARAFVKAFKHREKI